MKTLRILTVDDEVLALKRLKLLLETIPYAEQVGEAGGCAEALAKIERTAPDVVLLDIRMRDGSGFDVAEALSQRPSPPAIVFVTAFDRFAVRAFETSASDYVLKPVERDRLVQALARRASGGRAPMPSSASPSSRRSSAICARPPRRRMRPRYESEFWLRNGSGFVRIVVDTIDWVSSEDEYVRLHTPAGSHLMRGSIRQLEARLDPERFVRVHRKWLVRKAAIAELRSPRMGRPVVVLQGGQKLPTGRVYARGLRETISQPGMRARHNRPAHSGFHAIPAEWHMRQSCS